jgi:hypothetical protein
MKKILISFILIISMMGCISALDEPSSLEMRPGEATAEMLYNYGIGQPWPGGSPLQEQTYAATTSSPDANAIQNSVLQYAQYYTMPMEPLPSTHIVAPKKYAIEGKMPTTVYLGQQMQSVPYTQYMSYAANTGANALWIQGSTSWSQYAAVPQRSFLSLVAASSGGSGYLYEIYPDGKLSKNSFYFFPGINQMGFYADTIGQHILSFVINGRVSNSIVIDVVSYQPPVYTKPTSLVPRYWQPIYFFPPQQHDSHRKHNVSPGRH